MSEQKERMLRRKLQAMGCALRKSRSKNGNINDWCGYMIVDTYSNTIVAGSRFELSLEDVENYVSGA